MPRSGAKVAEKTKEIEQLKAQARADLHKSESKFSEARRRAAKTGAVVGRTETFGQSVRYAEAGGLPGQTAGGALDRRRRQKIVKLLIAEPAKVAYSGNGEVTLGCGVQKARKITVEYFAKQNAKLATAGEVATIDFQ